MFTRNFFLKVVSSVWIKIKKNPCGRSFYMSVSTTANLDFRILIFRRWIWKCDEKTYHFQIWYWKVLYIDLCWFRYACSFQSKLDKCTGCLYWVTERQTINDEVNLNSFDKMWKQNNLFLTKGEMWKNNQ